MEAQSPTAGSRLDGRSLSEIAELAAGCRLCRLCDARTHVVFGGGNPNADVMFVAEAPGYHDDRAGAPFTGETGALFGEMLREIGRTHEEVYVTSVVKCRPPRNRTPFPDEIEQCEGYLFHEVMIVRPRVICALGNMAIRLLTGKPHRLSDVHGTPIPVKVGDRSIIVLPLFHPGAAVHAPRLRRSLADDLRRVPALLRGDLGAVESVPVAAVDATVAEKPAEDPAAQLALDFGG